MGEEMGKVGEKRNGKVGGKAGKNGHLALEAEHVFQAQ